MRNYTQVEIARIQQALPEDLRKALQSVDMMQELRTIVAEEKLHIDEAGDVADAVELTLSGLLRVREFVPSLRELLPGRPEQEIVTLAEKINKRIFTPVRASLQQIDQAGQELTPEIPTQAPAVSAQATTTNQPPRAGIAPRPVVSVAAPILPVSSIPPITTDVSHLNPDPRVKLVPEDIKQRVNSDPYKEKIE